MSAATTATTTTTPPHRHIATPPHRHTATARHPFCQVARALVGHQLSVSNAATIFDAFRPQQGQLNLVVVSVMAGDSSRPFLAKRKGSAPEPGWSDPTACKKGQSYGEVGSVSDNGPDSSPGAASALARALFRAVARAAHAGCSLHLILPGCRSLYVSMHPLLDLIAGATQRNDALDFLGGDPTLARDVLTPERLACMCYVATTENIPGTVALPMLALYQRYATIGECGLEHYLHMLKEHVRAAEQRYADAGISDPALQGLPLPQDMLISSSLASNRGP